MTTFSDDRGSREERLSRLDQLEREISAERDRLNRPDTGTDAVAEAPTDPGNGRHGAEHNDERRVVSERRAGTTQPDHQAGSVRTVDLPELEDRVTESQREAWALGYQAGVADSQTRTGSPTQNPFHPLRGL